MFLVVSSCCNAGVVHLYGSNTTERNREEEALRESEARLKGLLEHLPEGVCLLDEERRLVLANRRHGPISRCLRMDWLPKPVASQGTAPVVATLVELGRAHILEVLELTGGQVSGEKGAAKILGMKPTTIFVIACFFVRRGPRRALTLGYGAVSAPRFFRGGPSGSGDR